MHPAGGTRSAGQLQVDVLSVLCSGSSLSALVEQLSWLSAHRAPDPLNAFAGGTLNHDVFENDLKVTSLALPPSSAVDLPQLNFGAGEPVLLEGTVSLGSGVPRIPNTCLILPGCGEKAGGLDVAVCRVRAPGADALARVARGGRGTT